MKEKAAAEATKAKAAAVQARAKMLAAATEHAKAAADAATGSGPAHAANAQAAVDTSAKLQLQAGVGSGLLVAAEGAGPMTLDDIVDTAGTDVGRITSESDATTATPAQGAVTPGAVAQGLKQVKDGQLSGSEMDVDDEEGLLVPSAGPSSRIAPTAEDEDDEDGNSSEWTLTEDATAVASDGEVHRGKRTRRGRGGSDDENVVRAKMGRGTKGGRGRRGGKASK